MIDAEGKSIEALRPLAVADLILAKKNLGTRQDMAPLVIGAGPGFTAGEDVDVVIETMRGYEPGKAIYQGSALENTGIPGMVGGYAKERVIHSPAEGVLRQKPSHWRNRAKRKRDCFCWGRTGVCDTDGNSARINPRWIRCEKRNEDCGYRSATGQAGCML